jgi:hypothetical protein
MTSTPQILKGSEDYTSHFCLLAPRALEAWQQGSEQTAGVRFCRYFLGISESATADGAPRCGANGARAPARDWQKAGSAARPP